jgi:mRNA interferase HigB
MAGHVMHIISKRALRLFWERHPQAEGPLQAWFGRVNKATWSGPGDVKAMFGTTVDFVSDSRAIFDIAGNKYRLVVRVNYRNGAVMVKFVGTHTEYDKIDANMV